MSLFGLISRLRGTPEPPGELSLLRYGPGPAKTIQYIGARVGAPKRAPVVFIHGGGWIMGRKELYTRDLLYLAEAGYPVFNLEYPMAPESPHPGILLSLLSALEWIREAHPEHEGVHLMGDSAGGNLVMMLGILSANPKLLENLGASAGPPAPIHCHSVVSLYGVLDRLSWIEDRFPGGRLMLECYAGKAAFEAEVAPGLAITPMDLDFDAFPPSFLAAGTADQLCRSSKICAERLGRGPGKVVHKEYPGEGHGFFNMGWRPASLELKEDLLRFLNEHDPMSGA
jgi:acetyl esterase/lipase